jgi:hypothetical protein
MEGRKWNGSDGRSINDRTVDGDCVRDRIDAYGRRRGVAHHVCSAERTRAMDGDALLGSR